MSKQRYVQDSFWTDPYIEKLSPDEKLVFLHLLTNPQCNIAGVYELRSKRLAYETGYDVEVAENILKRFENDNKILRYQDWIWVVNFTKNQSSNPAVEKGILRVYSELPIELQEIIRGYSTEKMKRQNNNLHDSRKVDVKNRDGNKCVLCGSDEELQVDHIKPLFLGGNNELDNLRTLCKKCNLSRAKTDYNVNSIYYPVVALTGSDRLSEDNVNHVELSRVKLSKVENKKYGEFKNVSLSEDEYKKLLESLGDKNTGILIEELSSYMASKGKKYASHYATILAWARRKVSQHQEKLQSKKRTIV